MGDFPTTSGAGFTFHMGQNGAVASATPNTKGVWYTQAVSTPYDCQGLIVGFGSFGTVNLLGDIAVGAAAAETIIIPNMITSGNCHQSFMYVPIHIPSGSRVAGRVAGSTGSSSGYFTVTGVTSHLWSSPVGGRVVDLATVSASSRGTLLDGGPSLSTYPATFTTIVASTTQQISAICLVMAGNVNATPAVALTRVQVAIGAASSEVVLAETSSITGGLMATYPPFWLPADIPVGSRISARCLIGTADATDRVIQFGLYGLV